MNGNNFIFNNKKGILLVIEGISGSGKSENVNKLARYLSASGLTTTRIEWNSNLVIRKLIKNLHGMGILTPLMYSLLQWVGFFIDYFIVLGPLLRKNHIVIADRYLYTAITRDAVNGAGRSISRFLTGWVRKPDWVVFFDTPPRVCYERIKSRGKALFHTNKAILQHKTLKNKELYYLKMMRKEYLRMFNKLKINNAHTNIIIVEDDLMNLYHHVESYINQKMGIKNYGIKGIFRIFSNK